MVRLILVNTNTGRWRRPTFCHVKADAAVNKESPDRRAATGALNSHTIKVVKLKERVSVMTKKYLHPEYQETSR